MPPHQLNALSLRSSTDHEANWALLEKHLHMHRDRYVSVLNVSIITVFLPSNPVLTSATFCFSGFAQFDCFVVILAVFWKRTELHFMHQLLCVDRLLAHPCMHANFDRDLKRKQG